jgi:hypothetical protein
MISKGYVGLFAEAFTKAHVGAFVGVWLGAGLKIEQVCPGPLAGNTTISIKEPSDVLWEPNLQFRVLDEITFSWAYLTLGKRVMETSGLPEEGNVLPLEILAELPGLTEVIDQVNDRRLDQLEAQGLM